MVKNKDRTKTHILWSALAWVAGLGLILAIWSILSVTVYKNSGVLPNIGKTFSSFFNIIGDNYSEAAIWIAIGQALACFLIAFILATALCILAKYFKLVEYLIWPFVTLMRALPTAILMILLAVFLSGAAVSWLVPIIVAYFIVFPIVYEGINNAIHNVNGKLIEMATVFNVSKFDQFKKINIPTITPYIFSACIAGIGLTFKIVLASQVVATFVANIQPSYPSVGKLIQEAITPDASGARHLDVVIAWGMLAVTISIFIELIIKEISRICMPYKYKDGKVIAYVWHKYIKGDYDKNK